MNTSNKGEIIIYQSEDNQTQIDVIIEDDTVWLTQSQMISLFDSSKANISEHIKSIYKEKELDIDSTVRKFRTVQKEGTRSVARDIAYYNLDVIISVGYRVKSKRGVQFRVWANQIIKEYLIKGYAINERRLKKRENELILLKSSIELLERSLLHQAKHLDEAQALVNIIADFSKGLAILDDYDNERLDSKGVSIQPAVNINVNEFRELALKIKDEFNSPLFGIEKDKSFESSVRQIYQSFGDSDIYPSIEEKAAMLLYLVVKNHSFIDGNKRIAATLFLYFLYKNNLLYRDDGSTLLDSHALASITLLLAESNPKEMELMKKVLISILNRNR